MVDSMLETGAKKSRSQPEGGSGEYMRAPKHEQGIDDDAAALHEVILDLHYVSNHAPMTLEKGSVWGTALVLPQIARSANWDSTFVMLAFRVYINYALCIILSLGVLTYIGEETHVMNALSGQMHLCDFGATIDDCPDGDHCVGPGGTKLTGTRMYGYTQWAIQKYVKQALMDVMPEKDNLINEKVDPGEYGVENNWCRLATILLFIMAMVPEMCAVGKYIRLLWELPTGPESWIKYSKPEVANDGVDDQQKSDPWERVTLQVSGIPLQWKLFYFFILVIPRVAICHFVLYEGVQLLMDTSGITDSVLSAVSMSFISDIAGMIFSNLAPAAVPPIMSRLQQPLSPQQERNDPPKWFLLIPGKVAVLLGVMLIYVANYYREKCTLLEDGTWVSHDMHLPQSTKYTLANLIFHNVQIAKDPFWSMPHE